MPAALRSSLRRRDRLRLPVIHGAGRWPALLAGCAIAGAGIAMLLAAELGVGPYDVLITGVATQLGSSFGVASIVVSAAATAVGWRLGAHVGRGTLVTVVAVGPLVDAWTWVLPLAPATLATRVAMLSAAVGLIGFGLSLIIAASLGPGPLEVVTLGLARHGVPLRWARTVLEALVLALGWLLGGAVGLGTVVIALAMGHVLAVFVPRPPDRGV